MPIRLGSLKEIVNLTDLADVAITSAAQYDLLQYNGTSWININDVNLGSNALTTTGAGTFGTASIRSGYLSDSSGSLSTLGNELLDDYSFDSSSAWTLGNGWSVTGGALVHGETDGADVTEASGFNAVVGDVYIVSVVVTDDSGSGVGCTFGGCTIKPKDVPATGTFTSTLIATATTPFKITNIDGGGPVTITSASVKRYTDITAGNFAVLGLLTAGRIYTTGNEGLPDALDWMLHAGNGHDSTDASDPAGDGADMTIQAGDAGGNDGTASSANAGNLNLYAGDAGDGANAGGGGSINIESGTGHDAGAGGAISISTGGSDGTGDGGAFSVNTGSFGTAGAVSFSLIGGSAPGVFSITNNAGTVLSIDGDVVTAIGTIQAEQLTSTDDIQLSGTLDFTDTNTQIWEDISGNLSFKDAVAGTLTLTELSCPPLIYISAATQSEGNLNLSDGTNWNTSKARISWIRVVTSSTDWDLVLYPDDDFDELGLFPSLTIADSRNGSYMIYLDYPYIDGDTTSEVHLKYTDNSGANTADIYIYGEKMR